MLILSLKELTFLFFLKKEKKGLEETAREIRYEIIESLNDRFDYFLTAHNSNDNAETVLFNITRGCALNGLCGIPAKRGNILRPMLSADREVILDFLKEIGCEYVVDSSNLSVDYTRNYIRNEIIPSLKKINPEIISSLNKLSYCAIEDEKYFKDVLDGVNDKKDSSYSLRSRKIMRDYIAFARKNNKLNGQGKNLGMSHINSICCSLDKNESSMIALPHGIYAIIENHTYRFSLTLPETNVYGNKDLVEGENYFADGKFKINLIRNCEQNETKVNKALITTSLNCGNIKGRLYARSRIIGDKIKCLNVTKSVKKEFISQKIPSSLRNDIPIICDDDGIVFVPYIGAADRVYAKKGQCDDIMLLTVEFNNEGDVYTK